MFHKSPLSVDQQRSKKKKEVTLIVALVLKEMVWVESATTEAEMCLIRMSKVWNIFHLVSGNNMT